MSEKIMTSKFRVSFPDVFEPKAFKNPDGTFGKAKYSVTALFPKGSDMTALNKAFEDAVKEGMQKKWGGKRPKVIKSPFRDGDEKETSGYEGMIFVKFSSDSKPGLVDESVHDIIDREEFYAGCYARATVRAFPYGGSGTMIQPGISFGLDNIQKLADGEPFGARKASAQSDFGVADSDKPENYEDTKVPF